MSVARGNILYIYEKCLLDGIGSFVSAWIKFLYISGSTIIRSKNSREIFKDRYKFSGSAFRTLH